MIAGSCTYSSPQVGSISMQISGSSYGRCMLRLAFVCVLDFTLAVLPSNSRPTGSGVRHESLLGFGSNM